MEYRPLGRTGVEVSPLCLGAMMFGAWGNPDHEESIRIIHRALDAGINFVDTADVYSAGESEEIVGKALAGPPRRRRARDEVPRPRWARTRTRRGNSRRWIMQEVEASLRRLSTDWIDLYQVHRPEPGTDIDETLGALTDLVRAGKIRYFGSSTFPRRRDRRGAVDGRAARPRAVRLRAAAVLDARRAGIERDVLPVCERYGMGVITWSPLAGGWLSGRYRKGRRAPGEHARRAGSRGRYDLSLPENQRKLEAADALAAARRGGRDRASSTWRSPSSLRHPAVTSAIIGPRTMEQLESQLGAADVELSDERARPHRRDRPARART